MNSAFEDKVLIVFSKLEANTQLLNSHSQSIEFQIGEVANALTK